MIPLSLLRRIDRWLRQHTPVWCVKCNRVIWSKDARYRSSTVGVLCVLCPDCERELYRPWSEK